MLEHFFYKELIKLLKDCHRVLKVGGVFSACVPNAEIYIKKYLNPDCVTIETVYEPALNIYTPIDYLNYIAYMDSQHRFLFDANNICSILKSVGFRDVKIRNFDPELDNKQRDWESLYVKALK